MSKALFGSKKKSTIESAESEDTIELSEESEAAEEQEIEEDALDENTGLVQIEKAADAAEPATNEETKTDSAES